MSQVFVVQINGEAWTINPDGSKTPLQQGDVLDAGTEVFTAAQSSLVIDIDGNLYTVLASSQAFASPEQLAAQQVNSEGAIFPESVNDILAVLDGEGDLLEQLEDAAAGTAGGGASSGHSFVQLTRISEQISPITTDEFNTFDTETPTETPNINAVSPGSISVAAQFTTDNRLNLSGNTLDVAPGSTVQLTITDQFGNSVVVTALVNADGSYSLAGVDISSLADGALTITASTVDNNGNPISANTGITLDAIDSAITVAAELAADNSLTLSG
ncbi:retention module-containing protein, partial [Alishewanella tabrizica]